MAMGGFTGTVAISCMSMNEVEFHPFASVKMQAIFAQLFFACKYSIAFNSISCMFPILCSPVFAS